MIDLVIAAAAPALATVFFTRFGTDGEIMSKDQQHIDMIGSLIFAAVWRERRQSIGESGTKAHAMVKNVAAALFEGMTGRRPTDEEFERMTRQPEPPE